MPFEKINHTKINKKTGKPLSKNSLKIYKGMLNKLADAGFDTKEKLIQESELVIQLLDVIYDEDTSSDKTEKRRYLSAIFYALDEYPLEKKQLFYDEFQKCKEKASK